MGRINTRFSIHPMKSVQTYSYQQLAVAYQTIGQGPPLLILHGWGSNSRVMEPLAKAMAKLRTCYLIDLPGFGKTVEPPKAWSVDDYVDLTEQFIRDTFDEPIDLLVHSFGGRITLKLCARPAGKELIGKVLITGGAGMKPKRKPSYFVKKYTAKLLKAPFLLLPSPLKEKALARLRGTALWKKLGSKDYAQLSGVMRETFVKVVTEYLEPCLPQIPHEILLLWGKDDTAAPLYQAQRMKKGIKRAALVVIEGAGHYAFLDRPRRFISITHAFFEG